MKLSGDLFQNKRLSYNFRASLLVFILLLISATNINHAKLINQNENVIKSSFLKKYERELAYTFNVADKLVGTGAIKLTIEKDKIRGFATGIGMVTQCNVDFHTSIDGALDAANGDVNVTVNGEGDPSGILIPGKVSFHGPLKGYFKGEKLSLIGKVHIKGKLARYAGFKNTEDLIIEIPSTSLARTFKEMQKIRKLASL